MAETKKKKSSVIFIILGFFVLVLNIIGIAITSFFGAKKYSLGTNYSQTYNVRYEFDPYSKTNSPVDGYYDKKDVKLEDVRDNMDKLAENYANILLDEGINTQNVYPEVYADSNGVIHAFLNVSVDANKVKTYKPGAKDDDTEQITPSLAYYQNLESADWSILYCNGYVYDSTGSQSVSKFNTSDIYMWNLIGDGTNYLTDKDSKIAIDSGDKNKIDIQLANGYSFGKKEDDKYEENSVKRVFADAKEFNGGDSGDNADSNLKHYPFMYVIHDLRGMLNTCEYYVYLGYLHSDQGRSYDNIDYDKVDAAWWELSDDERKFATDVLDARKTVLRTELGNDVRFNGYRFGDNHGFQITPYSQVTRPFPTQPVFSNNASFSSPSNDTSTGIYCKLGVGDADYNNLNDSYILSFLQQHDNDYNPQVGSSASLNYNFLNKYIVSIITTDNYTTYLPDKSPLKNNKDSDGEWLTIENNGSFYTTNMLYNMMTKYRFPYVMMDTSWPGTKDIARPSLIANIDSNGLLKGTNNNVSLVENEMTNAPIGIKNGALTSIIVLIVIALILGIIVSVLYRIPGLVGWLCTITPISLSLLLMFIMGFALSFSSVMAMLIVLIAENILLINILNKFKRAYLGHRTLDQALLDSYGKSFFSSIDILIVPVLLGVAVLLFSIGTLYAFGVGLITAGLFGWIFTYFLSYGINFLIFNNNIGMYRYRWLSPIQLSNDQVLDTRYLNPWTDRVKSEINLGFNKDGYISKTYLNGRYNGSWMMQKWNTLIFWIIAGIIIATGLSLLFTVGVPNSYTFYGGTRVMFINDGTNLNTILDVLNSHGNWHNLINMGTNNFVYIESSTKFDYATITGWFSTLPSSVFYVQSIDVTSTIAATKDAIYMSLVFLAFMCVYSLIRYNWVSILPTLLFNVASILLTLGIAVICQIGFDINIIYVIFLILVIGNTWLISLYAACLPRWVKKDHPFNEKLRYLMLFGLSSYNDNGIWITTFGIITFVVCMLFMPHQTIRVFGIGIMGFILSICIINFGEFYFLYIFTNIKNIYHDRVKQVERGVNKRNLDKVDEELIQGININARAIE